VVFTAHPFCLGNDLQSRADLRLHIVLPPRLECIRPENLMLALRMLAKATINQPRGGHPYLLHAWKVGGQYGIIDFPSPYLVMDEWIQRHKAQGTPSLPSSHWQKLEADELGRFEAVLRWWIEDLNEESEFRNRVRLIRFTGKEQDLQWLKEYWGPGDWGVIARRNYLTGATRRSLSPCKAHLSETRAVARVGGGNHPAIQRAPPLRPSAPGRWA
jgi:hypothetical protein